MPSQLPADCLNEIFEYLDGDKASLHSFLFVNRLWCQVAVRILWRDIWNFKYTVPIRHHLNISSQILSTLIACLPKESKEILFKNEIFISPPTSKPPLFNYAAFCQVFSICEISQIIDSIKDQQITSLSLDYNKYIITQEIIKMFMSQIYSLKKLTYCCDYKNIPFNISFTYFPGARECLTDLSELSCGSDIHSEFFYQLSQICQNLQSLTIKFENYISNGLTDLISIQSCLKDLKLVQPYNSCIDWTEIIPSLTKLSTLTKLNLNGEENYVPMSFISSYSNLQELTLAFLNESAFREFETLQNITFPNLRILKIPFEGPEANVLIRFLENNGKNLKELNLDGINSLVKSIISKLCPNLRKLFMIFNNDELDMLKNIFSSCQYLESINVWCSKNKKYLNEKELLKAVAKYSPKNFCELKILNFTQSELLPEDLKSFLKSWKNRKSKKSLTLIIVKDGYEKNSLDVNEENMKIIEKFKKLGTIRKFGTEMYDAEK